MKDFLLERLQKIRAFIKEYGKVTFVFALIIAFSLSFYFLSRSSTSSSLEVTFLDIGQGDAILVKTPSGKEMLIDGGPTNRILEELGKHISYFDHTLDVIVATHPDADHVTGLIPVLTKYEVATIITSGMKSETGVFKTLDEKINAERADLHEGRKGDEIDFGDGVVAHILWPNGRSFNDTNDASVSMVLTYGEHSFLLTGDLPQVYEPRLIGDVLPHQVTVYKAGHHGSKTSSSELLLSYIHPEYAVISAGKNNRYGHPHQETLDRLHTYAKEILSTVDRGGITFVSNGTMIDLETEK